MNGGKEDPLRPVFTHLGPGLGRGERVEEGRRKDLRPSWGSEPAASWREGSGGRSGVQAEGVARRAPAGGRAGTQTGSVISSWVSWLQSLGWELRGETLRVMGRGKGVRSQAVTSTHQAWG